jgi:DNA-binding NarL/FixJ family response regulator
MDPIRVLVANRPRLIRELLMVTISDQPDIEIVGEIQDEVQLVKAVEDTRPDFLIVALEKSNRLPDVCRTILLDYPQVRIIAIASDRNISMSYWTSLHIESSQIETSEAGLLSAIRERSQSMNMLQRWP